MPSGLCCYFRRAYSRPVSHAHSRPVSHAHSQPVSHAHSRPVSHAHVRIDYFVVFLAASQLDAD